MPRPTPDQIRGSGDTLTTYRWDVAFMDGELIGLDSNNVNYRCKTTTLPNTDVEFVPVTLNGHAYQQPSTADRSGEIEMTFYENDSAALLAIFNTWLELTFNPKTGARLTNSDLRVGCLIRLLNGQDERVAEYTLSNVFLKTLSNPDLGSDNEAFEITITLVYSGYTYDSTSS